jgi:hypothetical protein
MTVQEIYEQSIKPLSTADRFQLATMVLGDIPPQAVVDYRADWTEGTCETSRDQVGSESSLVRSMKYDG